MVTSTTTAAACLLAGASTAVGAAINMNASNLGSCDVDNKYDCGHVGTTADQCQAAGCCWVPAPGTSDPWCFYAAGKQASCPIGATDTVSKPFTEDEIAKIRGYFLANVDIQGSGAVVAAPDHATGAGGDYYFHWQRDGALSMHGLMLTMKGHTNITQSFERYAGWVGRTQNKNDPHGIDVRGEPKYTIPDGEAYSGGWCRPQDDGPALRAKTLINYIAAYPAESKPLANTLLWTNDASVHNGGVIKYDLDYVVDHIDSSACDLWEEIQSNDIFWTVMSQRASMKLGATFARNMGDTNSAARYQTAFQKLDAKAKAHIQDGWVFEATNRKKDTAVVEAFNRLYMDDGVFAPLDATVAKTVQVLNGYFCNAYTINKNARDNGIPGILWGRYENDSYHGGNPWILLTASLGELLYRASIAAKSGTSITDDAHKAWNTVLGLDSSSTDMNLLSNTLLAAGDGVMNGIHHYAAQNDMHMSEQIGRDSGVYSSARDLTWGYSNVLQALAQRDARVAM